jgi:hypothetical protein
MIVGRPAVDTSIFRLGRSLKGWSLGGE